ncbi:bifunctional dTDP-4-dehydrorhamnose 3,5-epimerase family protein/NAD(P)-dependent oxidoreductase [Microbacterium sp.]|uniref:bifunctional dTDP-4-dehydrorhamnose 3,5-epimerase family protein/NAD(P)-dependent oxidoreductase n=1 Tax=Microbacterium sp. TaxID=51671 RepID=UPI00281287BD|nr:bifunctional dTDP-4-dehydrorhamnose 3,5-epimerase family protein/NAD(P)-dependent oxidoreductase [Microbacterium sp.]
MIAETSIPGLLVVDLALHGDKRGWFKENWQRAKMTAAGLPDLGPVQNNIAFNGTVGATRGIHAEPWDKYVSVATGRIFGAWVDLRQGPTFGTVFTTEIDPSRAVFVPRGVGNAYQTLEPDTAYVYLVNDHWSPESSYTFLNLADETVAIPWPIPLHDAELSDRDKAHPRLADVTPVPPKKTLILGADGQLGRALRTEYGEQPHIEYATRADLDITATDLDTARRWQDYEVIINAAAYTAVDTAESAQGRAAAWSVNANAVSRLAAIAERHRITLVHVSSDYVFDGASERPYLETDPLTPLGVYGQSKAAGDLAAATATRHYIVRTSWVIGDGPNFVRTMASLAARGVDPRVIDDQSGRLTFAEDIAAGIRHLLDTHAPYGTYNLTGAGEVRTWAQIAGEIFRLTGHAPGRVMPVRAADYHADAEEPVAPRPKNSVLDLTKIQSTGFSPRDATSSLATYLAR